jgi:hypothetical protein
MHTIRRGVFETNSSATHSVSLIRKQGINSVSRLLIEEDNKIHVEFGEFGWGYEKITDQIGKLSYLCTMVIETEGNRNKEVRDNKTFIKLEGFKQIDKAIAEYCNCDGIVIDTEINIEKYNSGREYFTHEGYIDHQAYEEYSSLEDFLKEKGTTIIDFVFNDGIVIILDNDNH